MQQTNDGKTPFRTLLFLILLMVACGQSGPDLSGEGGSSAKTSVDLTLKMPQEKTEPSLAKTVVQKHASASTEIAGIRVSVTDENGNALVAPQTQEVSSGQKTVTIVLEVPRALVIMSVEVFDSSGRVLLFGNATADLSQASSETTNITINVVPPFTIDPESATMLAGETQTFTLSLSGLDNPALEWRVNDIVGGETSSVGSISPSDAPSVSYTAPNTPPESGQVIVKVNSISNPAIFEESIVTILPRSHTGEFSIAATSGEEQSISVAFDGTNLMVGIIGDETASLEGPFNINARRVSLSGTLLDSPIVTGRTGGPPFLAFDGINFLMVSKIDDKGFQLVGQFISAQGVLVGGEFPIASALGEKDQIAGIVFGGGSYLVVYYREVAGGTSDSKVFGHIIFPSGTVGAEIPLSSGFGDFGLHNVAFDGSNFFVVWTDDANDFEVKGRFVDPTGTLGLELSVNASIAPSDSPLSLIFGGSQYMVLWSDEVGGSGSGEWDIFGQRIDTLGNLVGGSISIATAPGFQFSPNIAFDGLNYLASWTEVSGSGRSETINGIFLDQSGNPVDSEFSLFLPDADGKSPYNSRIIFSGSQYFALINRGVQGIISSLDFETLTSRDVSGAFISPPSILLNVNKTGSGTGTVTSNPGTINCGTLCSEPFLFGTVVTLAAVPDTGSIFIGWSGDCRETNPITSLPLDRTKTCTANFGITPPPGTVTLTLTKNSSGTGQVTGAGTYLFGTTATVTAVPDSGSSFSGWSGTNGKECATGSVFMDADKRCIATFDPVLSGIIIVNPISGLITTEAGGTASFTVVLDTPPTADVRIGLSSSDRTEGSVSPLGLTFTIDDWNVLQTVTVTGVNDALSDGNIAYSIVTAAAVSADSNYNGLNPSDVSVTNNDNDAP